MSTIEAEVETRVRVRVGHLLAALADVKTVIPTHTSLPCVSQVRVSTVDGGVELAATDLDVFVTRVIPCDEGENQVDVLVRAKLLHDLLAACDEEATATLSGYVTGGKHSQPGLRVEVGECVISLDGSAVSEHPEWPKPADRVGPFRGDDILDTLCRAYFCASREESRPILNGACWQLGAGQLSVAATNGHRLVHITRASENTATGEMIIPSKAVAILGDVVTEDESVEVARDENFVAFLTARATVIARVIHGPYPNYKAVFPDSEPVGVLTIGRDDFLDVISRGALLDDHSHRVKLHLSANQVEVTAKRYDEVTVRDFSECEWVGKPFALPLNGSYLKSVLNNIESDVVVMKFYGMEKATTLQGINDSALFLIMPLRDLES
jgi:DNA polymerase III subunit beta